MKQRAGLGKKVSSIFDGVPVPNAVQEPEQAPKHAEPQLPPIQRQEDIISPPRQMPSISQPPEKPATAAAPQPQRTIPAVKPQPSVSGDSAMPKIIHSVLTKESISGDAWRQLIRKVFFSGDSELDARNRRAITLVGILTVSLIVIVLWTGVFSGSASNRMAGNVASAANNEVHINWTIPQPLPATMRDPMQVGSKNVGGGSGLGIGGAPVVKSIVFSDNPTAVISGQIVHEGQKLEGTNITIRKIYKDKVEFSENGKSWTQPVE